MGASLKFLSYEKLIIVLVCAAYIFFQAPFLHFDLWNDEIYTLKYFTFVSPLKTITDYHVPNNHIFYNLINNFYLRLTGEENVYTMMDHPWVLRILSFCYSAGTLFFTFKCGEKFFGRPAATLGIIFLCTTIPYYNFALGIRGYSLSTFLVVAVTYCVFSYIETPKRKLLFLTAGLAASAIYTIPLNLYSVISMLAFFIGLMVATMINKKADDNEAGNLKMKTYFHILFALTTGVMLGLLLYAPIFREVFFNEYVQPDPDFSRAKWLAMVDQVFTAFFSYRYLLLPLLIAGAAVFISRLIKKKNTNGASFFIYLCVMLLLPFAISFMRKEIPPDRTYVNLAPFFSLFLAFPISGIFSLVSDRRVLAVTESVTGVYCFFILSLQMNQVSSHLLNDIRSSGRSHTIYYSYYLSHFHPLKVVKDFREKFYNDSSFVVIRDAEPYDLPEYLDKFAIPTHDISLLDSVLMTGKKVFLFSRYPNEILNDAFMGQHKCKARLISEGISYHNLFELDRNEMP